MDLPPTPPAIIQTAPKRENEQSQSEVLLSMESLIKNHYSAIQKLKEEVKKQKEMLDDILANDPTYQVHKSEADDKAKVVKATKAEVMKQPMAADLQKKMKDMREEMKENQGSLSDYLAEYARMSGLTEIEMEDGTMMKIQFKASLVQLSLFQ